MEILEGLKEDDLKGLVLPKITIDEFNSKLADDGLVVGFFVQDKDPANDLNRFIQKSSIEILDTEVSPAPDTNGNYLVFVEFLRDTKFPKMLVDLLESLKSLTGIKKWSASCYKDKSINEIDEKVLRRKVRLVSKEDEMKENFNTFFKPTLLDDLKYENKKISFIKEDKEFIMDVVAFGHIAALKKKYKLEEMYAPSNRSFKNLVTVMKWFLGETWEINQIGSNIIISRDDSKLVLLIS